MFISLWYQDLSKNTCMMSNAIWRNLFIINEAIQRREIPFFQLLELKEFSRHSYKNVMHNPKRTCGIHDHEKIKMLALLGRYLIELSWKSFRIPIHNLILNWKMFFQQFDLEMQLIHDKARHSMNSKQLVIIMKSIKMKKNLISRQPLIDSISLLRMEECWLWSHILPQCQVGVVRSILDPKVQLSRGGDF